MRNILPLLTLSGGLLVGCAEPWEKDIPELQATINERQTALLELRSNDIAGLMKGGYNQSVGCPTIFVKYGGAHGNPHEVVQVHSVVRSNPLDGDHFYESPTRKMVAELLETDTGVNYSRHRLDWKGELDLDSLATGTIECEKDVIRNGGYRESWITQHTVGLQALKNKKPS